MRLFICIIIVLSCSGCATIKNTEAKLQSRVGMNVNNLISEIGPPTSSFKRPDGNTVYTWDWGNTMTGTVVQGFAGPQIEYNNKSCKISYTTNSSDIITNWNWQGNACATY
jgi:hypothetical protein